MKFNLDLNNIKYIKITYKNEQGNFVSTKAALKRIDARELIACTKFNEELKIDTPQEIILSIICNDGLYKTKTKLKSIENDEPYTFFMLETPEGIEYQQNREYFRIPFKCECYYLISSYYETQQIKTETFDISANGISLIFPVKEIPTENAGIKLSIDKRELYLKVEFIRCEEFDKNYKFSFKFSNLSVSDQDFISQICIKKQLEQRKSSIR